MPPFGEKTASGSLCVGQSEVQGVRTAHCWRESSFREYVCWPVRRYSVLVALFGEKPIFGVSVVVVWRIRLLRTWESRANPDPMCWTRGRFLMESPYCCLSDNPTPRFCCEGRRAAFGKSFRVLMASIGGWISSLRKYFSSSLSPGHSA